MKKSFKSMLSEKRIATKVGSVVLAVALLSCVDRSVLPVSADNTGIVTNGLVAQFDGKHNTKAGQDKNSTTWYDLAGNNNITGIPNDGTNYFSDEGLVLDTKQYTLSDTINNTVNGAEFTVELALGDLVSKGRSLILLLTVQMIISHFSDAAAMMKWSLSSRRTAAAADLKFLMD